MKAEEIIQCPAGAMFRHPEKGLVIGVGPFEECADWPEGRTAFYVNDFFLSAAKPWKIPSEVVVLSESCLRKEPLPVQWEAPSPAAFVQVFEEIARELKSGRLVKTVPAVAEKGVIGEGHSPKEIVLAAASAPDYLYPYAFWEGDRGICGATPEILFRQRGRRLETMALAGTARPEDIEVFRDDAKEIHEHEIVVRALLSRLSPHGNLVRAPRGIMELGSLVHFLTPLALDADEDVSPGFWLNLLHPTPALGCQPCTPETLGLLKQWRERLRCPASFGAPFGLGMDGEVIMLVAIRGVEWRGNRLSLTAGGGIVEASSVTHEWREFGLKRAAIRRVLGLA